MRHAVLGSFIFLSLFACNTSGSLDGFDKEQWLSDANGCEGTRREMIETANLESTLVGRTESEILSLLGKPNQNELYKRNQKFYIYLLDPCTEDNQPYFQLRFSATNIAREAMIYEP